MVSMMSPSVEKGLIISPSLRYKRGIAHMAYCHNVISKVKSKALIFFFSKAFYSNYWDFILKKLIGKSLIWAWDKAILGEKKLCEYFLEEILPTML